MITWTKWASLDPLINVSNNNSLGSYLQAEKLATKLYGEEAVQLIDIHQNIGKVQHAVSSGQS